MRFSYQSVKKQIIMRSYLGGQGILMAVPLLQVAGAFVEAIADGHTNIVNQVRASPLSSIWIQMICRLSHMSCL